MERFVIILLLGCAIFVAGKTDGRTFVDKTLWLKEFHEIPSKHIYLTAPLRFGKTTNMEMMKEFFSITNNEKQTRDLFEDTLINSKENTFFNAYFRKYPVMHLNFQPLLSTTNKLTFRENMCKIFTDVRNNTDPTLFLLTTEKKIAKLRKLNKACTEKFEFEKFTINYTKALYKHYGRKIIVLIDEMDALTRAILKRNIKEQNETVLEFKLILQKWLESNEHIEKTFSVGSVSTTHLTHMDPYPDCIEKVVFNDNERYAKYFGFSDKEVEDLLEKASLTDKLQRFKSYYDGYGVAYSDLRVYNTISPIEFIKYRKFAPYWSESVDPLKNDFQGLFSRPEIGSLVEKAIFWDMNELPELEHLQHPIGKDVFHTIRGNAIVASKDVVAAGDILFDYLKESGYLGDAGYSGLLVATNQDAAFALGTTLARDSNYYQNARNISSSAKTRLVEALKNLATSKETMKELAGAVHGLFQPACSLVTDERVSFAGPIFTILAYEDPEVFETVLSPLRVGDQPNRPDVVLVRKDSVAFVLTLRRGKSAREAAEAALNSEYERIFEEDLRGVEIESKIFVGLNLDVDCGVSIGFGEDGIQVNEIKDGKQSNR
ncbi:unnamed protein product [Bemisia tabaci]|uniref:AAA-ATPase-like domain-containing protein n=1 Tax=Bemisia tabaci TaxID=7038 RepID=A0A9P0FB01_BEMTA|nr:unnamed protein product [Bemisia tabaci]